MKRQPVLVLFKEKMIFLEKRDKIKKSSKCEVWIILAQGHHYFIDGNFHLYTDGTFGEIHPLGNLTVLQSFQAGKNKNHTATIGQVLDDV